MIVMINDNDWLLLFLLPSLVLWLFEWAYGVEYDNPESYFYEDGSKTDAVHDDVQRIPEEDSFRTTILLLLTTPVVIDD